MRFGSNWQTAAIGSAVAATAAISWLLIFSDQPGLLGNSVDRQHKTSESLPRPIAAEEGVESSSANSTYPDGVVQIYYDPRTNLVTLTVEDAPLALVLSRFAAVTRVEIEISPGLDLYERITIGPLTATPGQALDLLLEALLAERFYHKEWVLGDGARLARVVVSGPRSDVADPGFAGTGIVRSSPGSGSSWRSNYQEESDSDLFVALERAIDEGDRDRARSIAEEIAESGTASDSELALVNFFDLHPTLETTLDPISDGPAADLEEPLSEPQHRAAVQILTDEMLESLYAGNAAEYFDLIEKLHEVANRLPIDELMSLLDDHRVSSRIRNLAAQGLGMLGDPRAVDPLGATFDGRVPTADDAVDDAAANSLASLGGDEAVDLLLDAFNSGDEERMDRAAFAIASYGSDDAKQILMALLKDQNFAHDFPNDVIQALERTPANNQPKEGSP